MHKNKVLHYKSWWSIHDISERIQDPVHFLHINIRPDTCFALSRSHVSFTLPQSIKNYGHFLLFSVCIWKCSAWKTPLEVRKTTNYLSPKNLTLRGQVVGLKGDNVLNSEMCVQAENLLFKGQFAEAIRKKKNQQCLFLWWQRAGQLLAHSIWIYENKRKKQSASFGCRGRWLTQHNRTVEPGTQASPLYHVSLTVAQDISWLEMKNLLCFLTYFIGSKLHSGFSFD